MDRSFVSPQDPRISSTLSDCVGRDLGDPPNFFPLCLNVLIVLSFAGSSKFLPLVLDLQGLALALCGL